MKTKQSSSKPVSPNTLGRKEAYFEAAITCVPKVGMGGLTSQIITKTMGVSQPSFFYYFQNHEEFLRELVRYVTELNRNVSMAYAKKAVTIPYWDRIIDYVNGNLEWCAKNPAQVEILFYGLLHRETDIGINEITNRVLNEGEERLFLHITAGLAEGEFKMALAPRNLSVMIHRALTGAVLYLHNASSREKARMVTQEYIHNLIKALLIRD